MKKISPKYRIGKCEVCGGEGGIFSKRAGKKLCWKCFLAFLAASGLIGVILILAYI